MQFEVLEVIRKCDISDCYRSISEISAEYAVTTSLSE